jgi:hypothetical protein
VMSLSWTGHGKLPEVWNKPRHEDTHHHSQPTLPSFHYIPWGPSQCLPHPRSPTHHLSPTHSTLVITFLSPTLCQHTSTLITSLNFLSSDSVAAFTF